MASGKAPTGKVPTPPAPKTGNSGKGPQAPESGAKPGKTPPPMPKPKK